MIGLLLALFVAAVLMPRAFGALTKIGACLLIVFGFWVLLHPECESDACRQALFDYQHDAR